MVKFVSVFPFVADKYISKSSVRSLHWTYGMGHVCGEQTYDTHCMYAFVHMQK